MYRWLSREFTTVECYINESRNSLRLTKIGHDETVTTNREIVANHLNVSIFHHILSSSTTMDNKKNNIDWSQLTLSMDDYLPLRDVVFNTLREGILYGLLPPGLRLMEIQLAKQLGVSRTPVREAIRMLELEGLVNTIPRKGAEVAEITEKDLHDVLEVRCSLEELAVELACKSIQKEQMEALQKNLRKFKQLLRVGNATALAECDVCFHDIIIQSTNNKRLFQLLNNLREQMYRYRLEYLKDSSAHQHLYQEHEAIVTAIQNHNIEDAKKIIREHINHQYEDVIQSLRTHDDFIK